MFHPLHFRSHRSPRPGSDPPKHRTAATTSGAGTAGEIREHSPYPTCPRMAAAGRR
uniref:Uncharacterized protein n=1 Tax=Arundo donax TaxID=35708 RepID=A0A0A9GZ37_ARUDO